MLRVAAYARVSTDSDDQINSMKNQLRYFSEYIQSNNEWIYVKTYFDKAVSGTQTAKREGFNQMISDCRDGKIDLILTKEVSRFARNTVDTLKYTRLLNDYGVGVLFINDNIDTRSNDGEFRLSIMASVAQEESRKTSERVKWGQKRAMENGVVFGNNTLFGYTVQNGELSINNNEAETVRYIFSKYLNEGKGSHIIARELTAEGIKPPQSREWSSAMILRILKNEKYAGDLLQKKSVTENYLTHRRIKNNGIEKKIFLPEHHEAIIDKETWSKTQAELKKRKNIGGYSAKNAFSGKIICPYCKEKYVHGRKRRKTCGEYVFWRCKKCSRVVNHKILLEAMSEILEKYDTADTIKALTYELKKIRSETTSEKAIERRINSIQNKKINMADAYLSEIMTAEELEKLKIRYDSEISNLQKQLAQTEKSNFPVQFNKKINELLYSESVYGEILKDVKPYTEYLLITLNDGTAYKIEYTTQGYKSNYTVIIKSCEEIRTHSDNTAGTALRTANSSRAR